MSGWLSARHLRLGRAVLVAWMLGAGAAAGETVADFYRGRTVTLTVGTPTGGGYDTYARTLARHMWRHIPGEPQIVVKNAPGAGGIIYANALYNIAPKDGTEFGTFNRTLPLDPLLGNDKAQFDALKFTWLGSPANEVSTCVAWHASGITSVAELRENWLVTGGPGTTTDSIVYPKISNALLGTRFKIVSGYPGSGDAILAMERGETQGFCGWSYSSMEAQRPGWLKDGKIKVLLQFGLVANPVFGDAPLALDLTSNPRHRQIIEVIVAPQLFARPFMAPPGLPPERAAALQTAFEATVKDPAFVAEATERRLEVELVTGREILAVLHRVYHAPADVIDAVKAILK